MYHQVAAQSSFMAIWVADAQAHVQRLVSVVKRGTVLEGCNTEQQRPVLRFLWAKGLDAKIFIKKCFLFTVESVCLVKRFIIGSRNSLKDVRNLQTVPDQVTPSAGKVMLTVFWDPQGVLLAHFQKRGKNMNPASYCEVSLKLLDAIHRKLPGQLTRGVLLHHDNTASRTGRPTQERIQELQWELLQHPPNSPDLALSNFHLFGPLKKPPRWQTFR
jgi:hypothetical protein